MQLSENLSQELAQWYRQQQVENPGLDAPELWATDLSAQQRAVRGEMVARWMKESQDDIRAEVAGSLQAPDLIDVHRPSVEGAADVRAAYRPHGTGGLPAAPRGGQSNAAAEIISEGRSELEGRRATAEAMRGQHIEGASDLRQGIGRDHDRGFFQDPKLRE